jgi:hypothetical protein
MRTSAPRRASPRGVHVASTNCRFWPSRFLGNICRFQEVESDCPNQISSSFITPRMLLVTSGNGTFVLRIVLLHCCDDRFPAPE